MDTLPKHRRQTHRRPTPGRRALAIVSGTTAVAALVGGGLAVHSGGARADAVTPITVAIAGDSLSARANDWVGFLHDPDISVVNNFSTPGATSGQEIAHVRPVDVDVLVIELGTNDANEKVSSHTLHLNLDKIVATVGARHVVIIDGPPNDRTRDKITHLNRNAGSYWLDYTLPAYALGHGYLIADPFSGMRARNWGYSTGSSTDGVHPAPAQAKAMANQMAVFIKQAVGGATGASVVAPAAPARAGATPSATSSAAPTTAATSSAVAPESPAPTSSSAPSDTAGSASPSPSASTP